MAGNEIHERWNDKDERFVPGLGIAKQDRVERPHACEYCGHKMKWDDQECACTARSNRGYQGPQRAG